MDAIFAKHGARVAKLGRIAHGLTNGDHGGVRYTDSGVRYLRGQSVTELGLDLEKDVKFIADSEHNRMIRAEVVSGDVLYTIAGSIGNACVVSGVDKANINQAIVRIKPSAMVIGQYLCDFLNSSIGKLQSRRIANGGVQLNINFSEVKALKILLPKPDVQMQFVARLAHARAIYKSAIKKADDLLGGIDSYLLSELGIALPPEPENTIANRIFTMRRNELVGWRFDPYYFGGKFHALDEGLCNSKFESISLSSVYNSINNGIDCRDFVEDGINYAKVANVKPFKIDLRAAQRVPEKSVPDRGLVKRGDLLLTRKGTFGVAAVVDTDERFAVSSEVFRIDTDASKALADFLAILLNSSICQAQFDRQKIGAIMGSLTQASLRRIMLPLPPIPKQKEVCDSVALVQSQASALRQQAQNELDAAKRRIEAMLLGEVGT